MNRIAELAPEQRNELFATDGGAKRLDMLLHNQFDTVLETLAASLWEDAG